MRAKTKRSFVNVNGEGTRRFNPSMTILSKTLRKKNLIAEEARANRKQTLHLEKLLYQQPEAGEGNRAVGASSKGCYFVFRWARLPNGPV